MAAGATISAIIQLFGFAYTWLNNNLVSPLISFSRGFELAFIFFSALVFFSISIFVLLRAAKKLPKSYVIEITDIYGKKITIYGVRQIFATYEAAESYARMYQDNFSPYYKFKVVGVKENISDAAKSKSL